MIWRRPNRRHGMDCRAVGRLLQAFLDGEVDDPRGVTVAEHLDACLACGLEADTYRWLKAAVGGLAPADDPRQVERIRHFAEALVTGRD